MPTSAEALSNLESYQKTMQTPEQAAQAANRALGVDSAQQNVQGLRGAIQRTSGLLQQVAPSVYGRTGQSLVTSAQASKQIGNEQAPIQQNLQNLGTQYSGASEDYRDLLSKAQSQASNTLQGQQGQMSFLQQIYQNLAQQEEAQRQEAARQAALAEQKRQFDLTPRGGSSGGGGLNLGGLAGLMGGGSPAASRSTGPSDQLMSDIQRLIPRDYATRFNPGYTERQIERLQQAYPELKGQVSKLVYDYRKQYER